MNYSDFFNSNAGKMLEVTMTDGEKIIGKLLTFFSAVDNDPDPESIVVNGTELPTEEIADIKIID